MAGSQSQVQPLAQTFKNDTIGGCFLTSLDLFFAFKDPNLPIWVEIRNVGAGAPGQVVLPHSRKVLEPTQVNENLEDGTMVIIHASIYEHKDDAEPKATGIAQEYKGVGFANTTSWVENCETSAIGRALANW